MTLLCEVKKSELIIGAAYLSGRILYLRNNSKYIIKFC